MSDIDSIISFFQELATYCQDRGMQAAHELIPTRISDRHLQTALSLAADGNHPSIVGRYLEETLSGRWDPDLARAIARAVTLWQQGKCAEEIAGCFPRRSIH